MEPADQRLAVSLPSTDGSCRPDDRSRRADASTVAHPMIRLVHPAAAMKDSAITVLASRLGSRRHRQAVPQRSPRIDPNPFVLLSLADQELREGRNEQAAYLVEAAYEIFDRNIMTHLHPVQGAG